MLEKKAIDFILDKTKLSEEELKEEVKQLNVIWQSDNINTNLSFYDSYVYCYETINCFKVYTKDNINKVRDVLKKANVKSILDFGAGIGLSSLYLKEKFPNSSVYYYNIGTLQQNILKNLDSLNNITPITTLLSTDVFCAFDVFEHFQNPINEIKNILDVFQYKYLVFNNVFNYSDAIGHYKIYSHSNIEFNGEEINNFFNKYLEDHYNYKLIYTDNKELTIWKK